MPYKSERTPHTKIDQRDPATVRAVILARMSSAGAAPRSDSQVDDDVRSQVEECQHFIERMGWKLVADPYAFTEKGKSGYYRVERPVLDEVLKLAQRGEVDVIVVREFERLDRTKAGRYVSIGIAEKYGVEFRFANLLPDGKTSESRQGKVYLALQDEFGEMERDRIIERTKSGRERRYAEGKPGTGRSGPPFGYRWPDEKANGKTYDAYKKDDAEYPILKEMFERIANDESVSARNLAIDFAARGIPTPTGKGAWAASTISRIIRNPIYCGRGRTKRWWVDMEAKKSRITGEVHDYRTAHDRLGTDTYFEETYPIAEGAVPVLIEPELWERAQKAITDRRTFNGKLERVNSTRPAEATLLHGGLVRCANCGSWKIRMWPKNSTKVQYRCNSRASNPNQDCRRHQIPASVVDEIALRKVASVISDPEEFMALADAADVQAERVAAAIDLANTKLGVLLDLEAKVEKEREGYRSAIKTLSAIPGNDATVTDLRTKLAQLDLSLTSAKEAYTRTVPDYERAQRRQHMLDRISRFRNEQFIIDFGTGKDTYEKGSGERVLHKTIELHHAAEVLGMSEAEIKAAGVPVHVAWLREDPGNDPEGVPMPFVETAEALYLLLRKAPHARVRQLLRDLGVRVLVKHPWPKEQRALLGRTPPAKRVIVKFLADLQDADHLRPSQANWMQFA
jgi:DNA invertase Pin-like site-specific DNA recombinase